MLTGQRVSTVQIPVFLPSQAGASPFTVAINRANPALRQVLKHVLPAQLQEYRPIAPDVLE